MWEHIEDIMKEMVVMIRQCDKKKTENIHEYWDNECQKQVICI